MKTNALKAAFPYTLPICVSFIFLGASLGFLMRSEGFSIFYPISTCILIFAGSMQFVTVGLLLAAFNPMYAFFLTLMVNARHIFYGISMLSKYKDCGWKKIYLIYGMCDESFSINCAATPPADVDKGWFMFFVTLLDQIYWTAGVTLGALLGNFIRFDTTGLDFMLTALFVVLFTDQWLKSSEHLPAVVGLAGSALCLIVFGSESFLLPAMAVIVLFFTLTRPKANKEAKP